MRKRAAGTGLPRVALTVLALLAGLVLATVTAGDHAPPPDRSVAAAAHLTDAGPGDVTARGGRTAANVFAAGQLALPVETAPVPAVAWLVVPAPDGAEQAGGAPVDAPTGRAPPTSIG